MYVKGNPFKKLEIDEDGNVSCPHCHRMNVFLDIDLNKGYLFCHLCENYWDFPPNWIHEVPSLALCIPYLTLTPQTYTFVSTISGSHTMTSSGDSITITYNFTV